MRIALLAAVLVLGACTAHLPVARLDAPLPGRPLASTGPIRESLAAALQRGEPSPIVTAGLARLADMGASLTPAIQARLAPLIDPAGLPVGWTLPAGPRTHDTLAAVFAQRFAENAEPRGTSEIVVRVPEGHRLIEGIAWDPARRRLFVGSVIGRELLVREGNAWRTIPAAAPIGGVFGMAVDAPRRLLWLASSPAEPMAHPETAFSGLVAIDLDRLAEARRIEVPGAHLGDVAVAGDGTVYASDGLSGAIYGCRPGCTGAEAIVPPGVLNSPQGMVAWDDGQVLYVADYVLGLLRLNLETLKIAPLRVREATMLDGIDGLVRAGDALVAIQNGVLPHRILRIELAAQGRAISRVTVLAQGRPEWGEPTLGTVEAGRLLFVADGQWSRFGPGGQMAGDRPGSTPIGAVDVAIPDQTIRVRSGARDQEAAGASSARMIQDRASSAPPRSNTR
jgi:sugar lactone lactonase YvrE